MSLTLAVVVISSPATTGSRHTNSWPPWTIIAKFSSMSGSKIGGPTAGAEDTTANIGGAATPGEPAPPPAPTSRGSGVGPPPPREDPRGFSRADRITAGAYFLAV